MVRTKSSARRVIVGPMEPVRRTVPPAPPRRMASATSFCATVQLMLRGSPPTLSSRMNGPLCRSGW